MKIVGYVLKKQHMVFAVFNHGIYTTKIIMSGKMFKQVSTFSDFDKLPYPLAKEWLRDMFEWSVAGTRIVESEINPNTRLNGISLLRIAIRIQSVEFIDALIRAGAAFSLGDVSLAEETPNMPPSYHNRREEIFAGLSIPLGKSGPETEPAKRCAGGELPNVLNQLPVLADAAVEALKAHREATIPLGSSGVTYMPRKIIDLLISLRAYCGLTGIDYDKLSGQSGMEFGMIEETLMEQGETGDIWPKFT